MSEPKKTPTWKQVAENPKFQAAPWEVKQAARAKFFTDHVEPLASEDIRGEVRDKFFTATEQDVFGEREQTTEEAFGPTPEGGTTQQGGLQLPPGEGVVHADPAIEAAQGPQDNGTAMGRGMQTLGNRLTELPGNVIKGADSYLQIGEKMLEDTFGSGGGLMWGTDEGLESKGYKADVSMPLPFSDKRFGLDFSGNVKAEDTNTGLQEVGEFIASGTDVEVKNEYSVDRILEDPSIKNIGGFIAEQGPAAAADMGMMAAAPFMYFLSRNQELAEERMENQGREGIPNIGEMSAGMVGAGLVTALDRFSLAKMLPNANKAITSFRQVPGKAGTAAGVEAGTEALQEGGVEYATTNLGTEAGYSVGDAAKQGLGGAIIGAPLGGAGGAAAGTYEASQARKGEKATDTKAQPESAPSTEQADALAAQSVGDLIRTPRSQLDDMNRRIRDDAIYGETFKALRSQAKGLGMDDVVAELDAASQEASAALETETLAASRGEEIPPEVAEQLSRAGDRYTNALNMMGQRDKPTATEDKPRKPKVNMPKTEGMTEQERIAAWEAAWEEAGVKDPSKQDGKKTIDITEGQREEVAPEAVEAAETVAEKPAAEEKPTSAGVPAMITQKMKADLRTRGYKDADIRKLKPQEAWDILNTEQDAAQEAPVEAPTEQEAAQVEPAGLQMPGKPKEKPRVRITSEGNLRPGQGVRTPKESLEVEQPKGLDLRPKRKKTGPKPRVRVKNPTQEKLEAAAAEVNVEPTEGQASVGNYKKGHVRLDGLEISIENPKGSTRRGTDPSGRQWESKLAAHYGDIKRTEAPDGDNVDVFIGRDPDSDTVHVVDQVNEDGSFDEPKVILGEPDTQAATDLYNANYDKGWKGAGAVTQTTKAELKAWLRDGDTKQPFGKLPKGKPRVRVGQGRAGRDSRTPAPEGLQYRANGTPFTTLKGAELSRAFRDNPGATVEPVSGGYAVRVPAARPDSASELMDQEATKANVPGQDGAAPAASQAPSRGDGLGPAGQPLYPETDNGRRIRAAVQPLRDEGLDVEVVESEAELPDAVQRNISRNKLEGRVGGVYYEGRSYIIAKNSDPDKAIRTALHETVGHGGLRKLLGDELNPTLEAIYDSMPNNRRIQLEERYADQLLDYDLESGKRLVAEEYVAHLAETNPQHTTVSRVIAAVRKAIRRMFGRTGPEWSRAELVDLIANARLAAANNPARAEAAASEARFSLDSEKGVDRQAGGLRFDIEQQGGDVVDVMKVDEVVASDRIPTLTLSDLEGMNIFPTIADRTAAGAVYTGIDSSQLEMSIPLLGGPYFPLRESNLKSGVVWANRGKGVTGQKAAKLKKGANYMMVVMGDANMHTSNTTVNNAFFATLEAYARDKRITKKNSDALTKMVRDSKNAVATVDRDMKAFPGVRDKAALDKYLDGITFDSRRRLLSILGNKKAQALGAPSMDKIARATREPGLAGQRWGDGVVLLEVDQTSTQVNLGEEGTTPHPDFPLGIRGKLVGKLEAPVNYEVLWQDWLEQARQDAIGRGTPEAKVNVRRAFELSKPVVTVTRELIDRIGPVRQANIDGPRQARLAADFATGNWRTSDNAVNQNGVSPQAFLDALDNSDAAPTLSRPALSDLKKDIKSGRVKIFQLGDGEIYFTLTKRDDGGLELGGVVNNEQGARGIGGPAVLTKALEEGATHLDAFAVKSDQYPNGFLPTLYENFGFDVTGTAPFDPKFMTKTQIRDAKQFWKDTTPGFDPDKGMPDIAFMEWRGTDADRTGLTARYLESGPAGIVTGGAEGNAAAGEALALRDGGTPAESTRPAADDRGAEGVPGAAGRPVAPRAQRVLSGIAELSDTELKNLGLTPRDRAQVRHALGYAPADSEIRYKVGSNKSPRIRRSIQELVDSANSMSNWRNWYDRHENALKRLFGDEAELFQDILSATSQAAAVKSNVSLALKAYRQLHSGEPFTGYLPAVIANLNRIRDKVKLEGAKISQYGEANLGNEDAIAVDRHIAMLFFNTKTPNRVQIAAAKQRIKKVADRLGWKPREVQATLWAFNQVRLGSDPAQVQSYDTILEARADEIADLRTAFSGSEGEGVPGRSDVGQGIEEGAEPRYQVEDDRDAGRRESTGDRGGRQAAGGLAPLEGAPSVRGAAGPDPQLVEVAEAYAQAVGIDLTRQPEYVEVDPAFASRVADAYESMEHAPQDPAVRRAYRDLIRQTRDQYDALVDAGYAFSFFDGDQAPDPYDTNPWNAMRDLRDNKRMAVFSTEAGFGSDETVDVSDNPLLEDTGLRWPLGEGGPKVKVLANDLFRAVHDAFGHGLEGAGFRARGEENAWQAHIRLFHGPAVGAMTSETRGQNSWLNFGPHGEHNRTAGLFDTVFATQKTGLMPAWTWEEGRAGGNDADAQTDPVGPWGRNPKPAIEDGDIKGPRYRVSDSTGFALPDDTLKERGMRWMADKMRPLNQIQKAIVASGGKVLDDTNVYLQETLFHGKTEQDLKRLTDRYVIPLTEILSRNNISQAELDEYLYALHADERNQKIAERNPDNPKMQDGGSGMKSQDAQMIIDRVQNGSQQVAYDEAAELVYEMLQAKRDAQREGGLETDETLDAYDAAYTHYVPLKGWAKDEDVPVGEQKATRGNAGKGFEVSGKEGRMAGGRKTQAASPSTQAIVDTTQAVIRRRKNEVGQSLLALITDNPNPDLWQVFTNDSPDTEQVPVTVKDPDTGRKKIEVRERPVQMEQSPRYFKTKKQGKTFYMKIHDERLLNAMRNVGPEQNSMIVQGLGRITRLMSALVTSYSPEFMVTNFARDIQTALFNVTAEQTRDDGKIKGKHLARKVAKDVPKAMRASYRGLTGKAPRASGSGAHWDRMFQEFLDDGAKTGYFDMKDIDRQAKEIRSMMRMSKGGAWGNALKARKKTAEFVDNVNGSVENATRFSAYYHARQAGVSRAKAADLAKNLTVNFNRRGEAGTALNAFFMFANASIQGTLNFARTMVTLNDPKGSKHNYWSRMNLAQKLALGMIGGTFALASFNRMMSDEDDDGVLFYDKIQDHVKERNFIIMTGGKDYVKIPMPYGYNVFGVLGTQMEAAVAGQLHPVEGAKNLMLALGGSFSPIGFEDSEEMQNVAMKNLTPTVVRPFMQIAINEKFSGGPVYKENFEFGPQMPDSSLAFRSTPEAYKSFVRFLNEATGGNEWESGKVDVTPGAVEHVISSYLGGAYTFGEKTLSGAARLASGKRIENHRIPFAGKVYSEVSDYPDIQRFYERKRELDQVFNAFENIPAEEVNAYYEENAAKIDLKETADSIAQTLTEYRQLREIVEQDETLTTQEREAELDEIEELMDDEVDLFNRWYNEEVEGQKRK